MTKQLTEVELFLITGITQVSTVLYAKVLPNNYVTELLVYSLVQYFAVLFLKHILYGYLALTVALLLVPEKHREDCGEDPSPIDRVRCMIIFLVSIAIFASDFQFYGGEKLGKSMGYGLRLMDIGVGSFVFNAGLVSTRASRKKKLNGAMKAGALGIIRLVSKYLLKLDVKEAEFGRHLNFFFNLGVLNIISMLISPKHGFIFGLLLVISHEIFLKMHLENLIMNNSRENLIMENLEGISFLVPQFGVYLIASEIGRDLMEDGLKRKTIIHWCIALVIYIPCRALGILSSRRLHNIVFCLVIVLLHYTHLILFTIIGKKYHLKTLGFQKFASRNMFLMLILSNLLVLLAKIMGVFEIKNQVLGHLICISYLWIVYCIPSMARQQLKRFLK